MSGRDEAPERAGTRNQFTCSECGSTRWLCAQQYCSTLFYDLKNNVGEESEVDFVESGEWMCSECGQYAPPNIVTELWKCI